MRLRISGIPVETDDPRLAELLDVDSDVYPTADEMEFAFPGLLDSVSEAIYLMQKQQIPIARIVITRSGLVIHGKAPYSHIEVTISWMTRH